MREGSAIHDEDALRCPRGASPTFYIWSEDNMKQKTTYEKPMVITYSEEEILDIIGPAQTCTTGYNPT